LLIVLSLIFSALLIGAVVSSSNDDGDAAKLTLESDEGYNTVPARVTGADGTLTAADIKPITEASIAQFFDPDAAA